MCYKYGRKEREGEKKRLLDMENVKAEESLCWGPCKGGMQYMSKQNAEKLCFMFPQMENFFPAGKKAEGFCLQACFFSSLLPFCKQLAMVINSLLLIFANYCWVSDVIFLTLFKKMEITHIRGWQIHKMNTWKSRNIGTEVNIFKHLPRGNSLLFELLHCNIYDQCNNIYRDAVGWKWGAGIMKGLWLFFF